MKKIILRGIDAKGKMAFVDDEDYEYLSQWKWYMAITGYAMRSHYFAKQDSICQSVFMHRAVLFKNGILPTPKKIIVDHINRKRIDNRKSNLHFVTLSENQQNRTKIKVPQKQISKTLTFKERFPHL